MPAEFDELQELILVEVGNTYSETAIDHALNPRNVGAMQGADGFARVTGTCGDTMEIWIKVVNDIVRQATFNTDGCGPSITSGSMVTELARGKSIAETQKTAPSDVLDALGGLPQESEHCALLAINTLKAATREYLAMKREPWKRAYRKY